MSKGRWALVVATDPTELCSSRCFCCHAMPHEPMQLVVDAKGLQAPCAVSPRLRSWNIEPTAQRWVGGPKRHVANIPHRCLLTVSIHLPGCTCICYRGDHLRIDEQVLMSEGMGRGILLEGSDMESSSSSEENCGFASMQLVTLWLWSDPCHED